MKQKEQSAELEVALIISLSCIVMSFYQALYHLLPSRDEMLNNVDSKRAITHPQQPRDATGQIKSCNLLNFY